MDNKTLIVRKFKTIYFSYALLAIVVLNSCNDRNLIIAGFDIPESLNLFDSVQFINTSVNADNYFWDFGDSETSTLKSPKHLYKTIGKYTAKLQASAGKVSHIISKSFIISASKPIVNFSISNINLNLPINTIGNFKFTNNCQRATSFLWNFGDGTLSTENEPTHFYQNAGTYNITLTAFNVQQADSIHKIFNVTDTVSLNKQLLIPYPYALIDIDDDGKTDFELHTGVSGGITGNSYGSNVTPTNNYEISSINYNAKRYVIGDKILNTSNFSNSRLNITYNWSRWDEYGGGGTTYGYDSTWIKNDFGYIGFRKTVNNLSKVGWIKLKVESVLDVTLISYKIPSVTESLLIDK